MRYLKCTQSDMDCKKCGKKSGEWVSLFPIYDMDFRDYKQIWMCLRKDNNNSKLGKKKKGNV